MIERSKAGPTHTLRVALVVAKKDALIYYFKAPVVIFGILFPLFFFLAFAIGRPMSQSSIAPSMIAMAVFFTASAIGPLVTPWERSAKTYERLLSCPLSVFSIVLGDVIAGFAFGLTLTAVPLIIVIFFTSARVAHWNLLLPGLLLSSFCFAALGTLLSSPSARAPSKIMMLSSLVRIPLIFISGIFVPLSAMPSWSRLLSPLSPLSYCADVVRFSFGEGPFFPIWLSYLMLAGFSGVFLAIARHFHRRAKATGL
ncbi:ABC transporter permease [candidate division TA06 bacterium]|uniref:Transport permease protein n=1 Tax=candidate division TA06 bacterium TaxID=2250710 RepID=A0A523UTZ2_UNCT6|nr:MAG: ABC transporter permease [candidate division TA06 bacterium]